jgi:hypothetical protein
MTLVVFRRPTPGRLGHRTGRTKTRFHGINMSQFPGFSPQLFPLFFLFFFACLVGLMGFPKCVLSHTPRERTGKYICAGCQPPSRFIAGIPHLFRPRSPRNGVTNSFGVRRFEHVLSRPRTLGAHASPEEPIHFGYDILFPSRAARHGRIQL